MSADGTTPLTDAREISLDQISVVPGFNPRRHFDTAALESLAASIAAHGVVQPIVVRVIEDREGFDLVAGERRYRASKLAGKTTIPAIARVLTDAQATAIAQLENEEREGLTPADEAISARRAVDALEGDRAEAARLLGWTRSKLDARLLLLQAEPFVLDAVSAKRIKIGHAELLSTLTPNSQRVVFDKLLANDVTVDALRTSLASFTQDLKAAPFDTAGCVNCQHNSATQSSLFEFHVGEGRCAWRACWDKKTDEHVMAKRDALATEWNVVHLDRDKDPVTYIPLTVEGPDGVSQDQFDTGCKACAKMGALLHTKPGSAGQASTPTCFDRACNSEKAAEYQATLPPEPEAPTPGPGSAGTAGAKAATKKAVKKLASKGKKPAPAASPSKITQLIEASLRDLAAAFAAKHPDVLSVLLLDALEFAANESDGMAKARLAKLFAMTEQERSQARDKAVDKLMRKHTVVAAMSLKAAAVPLVGHFIVTRDFLAAHTKSGLEALLAECEWWKHMDGENEADQRKAFKKLLAGKPAEIIDAVVSTAYSFDDFTSFVPASVTDAFRKLTEGK